MAKILFVQDINVEKLEIMMLSACLKNKGHTVSPDISRLK